MYNLLDAGFNRLKKNKLFWSIIVMSVFTAFFVLYNNYKCVLPENAKLEDLFIKYVMIIGFLIAVFVSLFVGIEHENGTIKNQIIAGHSRTKIYLSNLVISIVGALAFQVVYMLVVLFIGVPMIGGIKIPIGNFMYLLFTTVMTIVAYSAFFNFISMLCSNITVSAVFCVVSVIVMFFMVFNLSAMAESEEFYENTVLNMRGEIVGTEMIRNDSYPGDFMKEFSKSIMYIFPTGTASKLVNYGDFNDVKVLPMYSFVTVVVLSAVGVYVFNRKDLK